MSRHSRVAGLLLLAVLALLAASCTKLSTPTALGGGIPVEVLGAKSTVPAEWGSLISVSGVAEYPDLVQLWFQDRDGTVRYAVVSLRRHQLLNAHVIRRS